MTISEAKIIIKQHPLLHGEQVSAPRKQIALAVRKLIKDFKSEAKGMEIIRAIVSTGGILCTGVYSAALNYLEINGVKEIDL